MCGVRCVVCDVWGLVYRVKIGVSHGDNELWTDLQN